jgi:hypothetical protein
MRWKLLRRRWSVSAPRMIIRSHLPWPIRWAVAAVVLGFSAALALWAFQFGRGLAGLDEGAQQELERLRAEVQHLRDAGRQAASVANTAESLLKAERAAQDKLAQQLRQLEADKQALQADLGFFEQLMPASGVGLQLRGAQLQPMAPGQWRLQMLITQNGKAAGEFLGRWEVQWVGSLAGRPWTLVTPGTAPLQLRQYARVEGVLNHPPEAVIKAMTVRVLDAQGTVRATQSLKP